MTFEFRERYVIESGFTSDDVDFVSMQHGWILKQHRIPEAGAYVDVWTTLDRQTEIHQVDDRPIDTRYFVLHGTNKERVAQQIRDDCALWTTTRALRELAEASTRNEKLVCIYAAALSAGEDDGEQVTHAFRAVQRDLDPAVRQALIIATGYFPYPGLVGLVEALRDGDPVDHVRKNAQLLSEGVYTTR